MRKCTRPSPALPYCKRREAGRGPGNEANKKLGESRKWGLLCIQCVGKCVLCRQFSLPPHAPIFSLHSLTFLPSLTPSSTPSQAAPRGNYFELAPPSTPVHFNRVSCLGNESSLLGCDRRIVKEKNRSNHIADAGVICTGEPNWKDTISYISNNLFVVKGLYV